MLGKSSHYPPEGDFSLYVLPLCVFTEGTNKVRDGSRHLSPRLFDGFLTKLIEQYVFPIV